MAADQGKRRMWMAGGGVAGLLLLFALRLTQVQVVQGAAYLEAMNQGSSRVQKVEAVRGEVVDREGRPLIYNTMGFNLVLDRAYLPAGQENASILKLCSLLEGYGQAWVDTLPISQQAPFTFLEGYSSEVARLKSDLNLGEYASAEDAMYWLCQRYGIDPQLPSSQQRLLAGVRYEMQRQGFSLSATFTLAEDLTADCAAHIRQLSYDLPGVNVVEMPKRQYYDGTLAPHVLGRVGPIYAEEYDYYKERGYAQNAIVGKEGVERAFEEQLRGQEGSRLIQTNAQGKVMDVQTQTPAVPGHTITLTLDAYLQRVAQDALQAQIANLNQTAPEGQGREAEAGAVVAVDVKTGEVLVSASYPSYDQSRYNAGYSQWAADPLNPLFDRALQGQYTPGSIFKPAVGLGGLSEGVITADSHVYCGHVYTYFEDYQPTCLGTHGDIDLERALSVSCNIFFYDTGRQLGIARINHYASQLGLGQPTGIELPEATGQLNDPDTDQPGDVLQASIGQLNNRFTPIQLANYAATLANRGQRMQLTILKSIDSFDKSQNYYQHTPQVAAQVDADPAHFESIIQGMVTASRTGSAAATFGSYPLDVAAKTGTPEVGLGRLPNSTFIAFAPAEDPQIAVAVVIEKGWHGYTGAPVAKAIFDAYFYNTPAVDEVLPPQEAETALPADAQPQDGQDGQDSQGSPEAEPAGQPSSSGQQAPAGGEESSPVPERQPTPEVDGPIYHPEAQQPEEDTGEAADEGQTAAGEEEEESPAPDPWNQTPTEEEENEGVAAILRNP